MKFLCDVHIPFALVKFLSEQGFETMHVNSMPKKWHTSDSEICPFADSHNFIVITKDHDFKNTHFITGSPKKLIRIALGNISNKELIAVFNNHFKELVNHLQLPKCYIEIGKDFIEQNNL
jgi:predicted nuclease of predicted toxin-antitoxin system